MSGLFPDPYFHIGGDEVNFADWESNPSIQAFMKSNEIATTHALQSYFNKRVQEILKRNGKKMVGWDEILNPALGNDIVVQSWRTHKSLFEAVQKGNKAILSAGYYLDHKLPASKHYQTDPGVLPGAITIEPDSLHWQQYDLIIDVSDAPIKTNLVLYGTPPSLRGLFYLVDNATAFENAQLENDHLEFSFHSDFGEIDLKSEFRGDSLLGKMSLGLLSFDFKGIKTGGNDWAGTKPPRVEQMKPLTAENKKNILGGEAAMWSEVVSMDNIDSRIWPRAAAIAEKWWSDPTLTKDITDMYRRLEVISQMLDRRGVQHIKGQEKLITDLAQGKETQPLKNLVNVLEEVKYYERLSIGMTTATPMNEVVDAAPPESKVARQFANMVDAFLADSTHQQHEMEIRKYLKMWRSNHDNFLAIANGNPRLEKVILTSEELSTMAHFALLSMDALQGRQKLSSADKEAMTKKMTSPSRAGVLLAVAPSLTKLVEAVPVN
jgi:hexosaminidase